MKTIGFIAPNQRLLDTAIRVVADMGMEDRVALRLGNLEAGLAAARELEAQGAEVIVTRGGTGGLIQDSALRIPLVEIPIDGREIVAAIIEARRLTGKPNPRIAALAFRSMRYGIQYFATLGGLDIHIYEFGGSTALEDILDRIVADGTDALLGGQMSAEMAVDRGIVGVVLESNEEAIRNALVEAEKVALNGRLDETRMRRMRIVLDLFPDGVLAVDNEGRIQLANPSACRLLGVAPDAVGGRADVLLPFLDLDNCLKRGESSLNEIHPFKNNALVVNIRPIRVRGDITGAVITLQETGNIRELEAKIRNEFYAKGLAATHHFADIAMASPVMRDTVRKAEIYAATRGTVLITGETGTGKELFAQSMHNASLCRQGPFVAVNCAALPPSLLESELFGYEEGAFTGAMRNGKPGFFELAHGGTIFLDEISEIDRYGQTRLLRILQERRSMRLGGGRYIQLDVRVVAATNRHLKELVAKGEFREDLYYRLTALTLHLPPLRARGDDIDLLANRFASAGLGRFEEESYFTPEALECLRRHPWPGNVRELQNIVERLCLFYDNKPFGEAMVRDALEFDSRFDEHPAPPPSPANPESERDRIIAVLRETSGNQRLAAERLGINPSTLYRKMKRLDIRKTIAGSAAP